MEVGGAVTRLVLRSSDRESAVCGSMPRGAPPHAPRRRGSRRYGKACSTGAIRAAGGEPLALHRGRSGARARDRRGGSSPRRARARARSPRANLAAASARLSPPPGARGRADALPPTPGTCRAALRSKEPKSISSSSGTTTTGTSRPSSASASVSCVRARREVTATGDLLARRGRRRASAPARCPRA